VQDAHDSYCVDLDTIGKDVWGTGDYPLPSTFESAGVPKPGKSSSDEAASEMRLSFLAAAA
jgi:hypothetical protein